MPESRKETMNIVEQELKELQKREAAGSYGN
jgi:hypothetical protein